MVSVLDIVNPLTFFRNYVQTPLETFISTQYLGYKKKTDDRISSVKALIFRAAILSVFLSAILWISVFLYVVFYYTYMPNVTHVRPVYLQFKSCDENMGICSFPSAHVQLTKKASMLMPSQAYRVRLILEMPESEINKDIGMFMVCTQMRAKAGVLVSSSCRSAMLRHSHESKAMISLKVHKNNNFIINPYSEPRLIDNVRTLACKRKSVIHQWIRTVVLAPLLLAGYNEEKQRLYVELFSDLEDDQDLPITDAYVELQTRFVQVYSCELHIDAHFTGLRHFMYFWPKTSAFIGISTNLLFVSLVFLLSWYNLQDGLPDFIKVKLKPEPSTDIKEEDSNLVGKLKLESPESSVCFDDDSFLEDLHTLDIDKEILSKTD